MSDVSKRNKAAKRRGAQWETDLLNYLRGRGLQAERNARTGVKDEGDLWLHGGDLNWFCVVEAKNTARFSPSEWVEEARVEATHFANARGLTTTTPVVISKRRNKPVDEAYVIQPLSDWLRMIGVPD